MKVILLFTTWVGVILLSSCCVWGKGVPPNVTGSGGVGDTRTKLTAVQKRESVNARVKALERQMTTLERTVQTLMRTLNRTGSILLSKQQKLQSRLQEKYKLMEERIKAVRQLCRGIISSSILSFHDLNQGIRAGHLLNFSYRKKRNSTLLKIIGNFGHATSGPDHPCTRWYFKIDGHQCSDPRPISALAMTYVYDSSHYIQRRLHMEGFCRATAAGPLLAGNHTISLSLDGCGIDGTQLGWASTGWRSPSTFSVEEHCPHKYR